jgi:hypothetical protein
LYYGNFLSLKALVVSGVKIVLRPITPILIPLLNSYIWDNFCLGRNSAAPLSDLILAAKEGAYLNPKNGRSTSGPKSFMIFPELMSGED